MRVDKKYRPQDIDATRSDWSGLQIRLYRIYEGYPLNKTIHLPLHRTHSVALWKILDGEAEASDEDINCKAKEGEWIVCLPGKRLQKFSDYARLFAIHLEVECFGNNSGWKGPHLIALGKNPILSRDAGKLWKVAEKWGLCRDRYVFDEKIVLPITGLLEVQQTIYAFFLRLLKLLARYGVSYAPMSCKDARVNEGMRWLVNQPLSQSFSRTRLSKLSSLSPSRLDRLWRQEIGMTAYQYWELRRLRHACHHLRNPEYSIKEIAFELGFRHLSQFSTWFRAHEEESPSEFRSNPEPL